MMDGLDWQALGTVMDMLGIRDPEALIADLVTIRDAQRSTD